jgi:hypothetical protein
VEWSRSISSKLMDLVTVGPPEVELSLACREEETVGREAAAAAEKRPCLLLVPWGGRLSPEVFPPTGAPVGWPGRSSSGPFCFLSRGELDEEGRWWLLFVEPLGAAPWKLIS